MCGIAAVFGAPVERGRLESMNGAQSHRGPDASGVFLDPSGHGGLGHTRLAIIDLTEGAGQPMSDPSGRYWLSFNGEIYNYLELRAELGGEDSFQTSSDTEVLLRAYVRWGPSCLERFLGMFAFVIWDKEEKRLFSARDRFGVKPLYYAELPNGQLAIASEIKALFEAGVRPSAQESSWATYLSKGIYEHGADTFWNGIQRLEAGCVLEWSPGLLPSTRRWYDLVARVKARGYDVRADEVVTNEAIELIHESIGLRFRADVPVGLCVSGGLDSSLLVRAVLKEHGLSEKLRCFTFECGDPAYDETPWVRCLLGDTEMESVECPLRVEEVSDLADRVARNQEEPFGGIPTLGMAKVHQEARRSGVRVLLDGNGLDEGWGGYDYYQHAGTSAADAGRVQGAKSRSTRPDCLSQDFLRSTPDVPGLRPFEDEVMNLQVRDLLVTKIPRAMRFADRVSMLESREVREPFLDHRLVELGLCQPVERKIRHGQGKWLMREAARRLLPSEIREAPKRPVQTPQREWLRGPLKGWVDAKTNVALEAVGGAWLNPDAVRLALGEFQSGEIDNSFWVWQWVNLGLMIESFGEAFGAGR